MRHQIANRQPIRSVGRRTGISRRLLRLGCVAWMFALPAFWLLSNFDSKCSFTEQSPATATPAISTGQRTSKASFPTIRSELASKTQVTFRSSCPIGEFPRANRIGTILRDGTQRKLQLCQAFEPLFPGNGNPMAGMPWEIFAQGEYVGPHRTRHVPVYRLRVDDQINLIYRLTRKQTTEPYALNVGDQVRIESLTDTNLDREVVIQPDGSVTTLLLGQVSAAGRTVNQLTKELEERYKKYYKVPAITVSPISVNTRLEDLRASVDSRFGRGGQGIQVIVTPEGTIQLPAIGSVSAQGLTLGELKREIDERYDEEIRGIEVTPILDLRAPRFINVLGEVFQPGQFEMVGPTTVLQTISLAGSWTPGANIRQIVVFRRTEDWQLIATKLNLRHALFGKEPTPIDEIWLRDSDVVVIPKTTLLRFDELVTQVFVDGIYGVIPFQGISISMNKFSTI